MLMKFLALFEEEAIPEEEVATGEESIEKYRRTTSEEVNLDEVQEHLWSDIPTGEPLTEDIFSTFTAENTEEQPVAETDVETEAIINNNVDEIFDAIPEEEVATGEESIESEEVNLDEVQELRSRARKSVVGYPNR